LKQKLQHFFLTCFHGSKQLEGIKEHYRFPFQFFFCFPGSLVYPKNRVGLNPCWKLRGIRGKYEAIMENRPFIRDCHEEMMIKQEQQQEKLNDMLPLERRRDDDPWDSIGIHSPPLFTLLLLHHNKYLFNCIS